MEAPRPSGRPALVFAANATLRGAGGGGNVLAGAGRRMTSQALAAVSEGRLGYAIVSAVMAVRRLRASSSIGLL